MSIEILVNTWGTLKTGLYPNNEATVSRPAHISATEFGGTDIKRLRVRQSSMQEFVTAMFFVDACAERGVRVKELEIPFVPGSRMDHPADGDFLLTLKSVAKMINDRKFDKVYVLDPHSPVTPALIDRCDVMEAHQVIGHYQMSTLSWDGIIAPDEGAVKRAQGVATRLGLPLYRAWKKRDPKTNELSGFGGETLPGLASYLVVDDICDAGGTFVGLAEHIKKENIDVDLSLYVTHGLFSKEAETRLFKHYRHIITTNSIPVAPPGVIQIPVYYS